MKLTKKLGAKLPSMRVLCVVALSFWAGDVMLYSWLVEFLL